MTFTVTYRGADGAVCEERVEAAGRGECFAQCRARGIAPISVREGWNGRGKALNPGASRKDGAVGSGRGGDGGKARAEAQRRGGKWAWGIVLILAIAAIGGGVWWWLGRDEARPSPEPEAPRSTALPKAVTPTKPKAVAESPAKATNAVPVAVTQKSPPPKKMTQEERIEMIEKKILETPLDLSARTNRAFRTGLEQTLAAIFTTQLGAPPPMMPLRMTPVTYLHLQEILNAPNPINESDSEKVAVAKFAVQEAKNTLKEYIDGGGDPEKFLEYYHGVLKQAHAEWKEAQFKLIETMKKDPGLASTMEAEINEYFTGKGIRPVKMPPKLKERYGIK